jgi:Uma2 family endonuclease
VNIGMALTWRKPRSAQDAADERFLLTLEDDTEEAPWMVMGDPQFWSASGFAHSLRQYAQDQHLPWYVASMLPIRFAVGEPPRIRQLAPDCFVAFVPDHERNSYSLEEEGVFPAFVLEVVSPSSVERDTRDKVRAYRRLGAREYVLFTPHTAGPAVLAGYHRDGAGRLVPWPSEADGSLLSQVLGLRLLVQGNLLRAQTLHGEWLRTLGEAEAERRQEARARLEAEAEIARLRQDLDKLKRDGGS